MALNEALAPPAAAKPDPLFRSDAAAALLAALVFAMLHAAKGFPDLLTVGGDNDSLLRLVEVRDWLGGQGWFDLHQHRMGPDGGFAMHWSRIVDAPLGGLVLLGSLLSGSRAAGEIFAQVAWPLGMFAGCIFALLKIARRTAGEAAILPALVLGTASLHFAGTFAPGNIDHHGFQLLLTLCAVALLLRGAQAPADAGWTGAAAGCCAAAMLGVGAETAPYVAVAGLWVAARFALAGEPARGQALGFGLGFAGSACAVFLGTVSPASWMQPACDAFAAPHGLLAVCGGLGLAAIAGGRRLSRKLPLRLLALAALGALCAGMAAGLFPQCLGDPYAGVDPRLRTLWLDGVAEAQPFARMVADRPVLAAGYFATPILAAAILAWRALRRREAAFPLLLPGLMLLAALGVSLWQVRGTFFSLALAVPVLAGFVADRRLAGEGARPPRGAAALTALSWLVSIPVVWSALVAFAVPATESEAAQPAGLADKAANCEDAATFDRLGLLPPAKVLAISNLGSLILAHTHHRVLAGPYHRNASGNLAALEIWMAEPAEARIRMEAAGARLLAFCSANAETLALAQAAPQSLIAELGRGRAPSWLEPVAGTAGRPMQIYRIAD